MHQEIVAGRRDQAFFLEPIERPRRPASVVVTSHAGVVQQQATTGCEIDPFESTLAEPAAAGATVLYLKSTEGITPGHRYVIARHGVVVTAADRECVRLRRALPIALPASTPLLGCRISAPIDPAWAGESANLTEHLDVDAGYVLTWTYHGQAGDVVSARSTADLVRTPQLARVTPDDVEGRFPGWRARVEFPEDVIAEAFDLVRRDTRLHRTIRRARHAFALRELAILAAHVIATEHAVLFGGVPHQSLEAAERRYRDRLAELVRETEPSPVQASTVTVAAETRPFDVSHAGVVDAMMEWVARNPLLNPSRLADLEKLWIPQLQTREARSAAAKFLRTLYVTRKARRLRDQLVDFLESS